MKASSNATGASEEKAAEMSDFWARRAKAPAPPDPTPFLVQTSVQLMIHRLADNLPPEYAREIQRVNYDIFSRMKKHAMPEG